VRKYMIAGNWKMNKTPQEASMLAEKICSLADRISDVEIVLCPAFVCLKPVYEKIKKSNIRLGAQNLYHEDEGAFTGEISAPMLKEIGCKYVIIGHSERRTIFGETDEVVNKKVMACLKWNLTPIICVGETLSEREENKTEKIVNAQVEEALKDIKEEQLTKCVIAYEPIWAIGTGKTATPGQANKVHRLIREIIKEKYSEKYSEGIRILYGGSVKPESIKGLITEDDIDGALVGGASLEASSFVDIIKGSLGS
jgi:triosephosphate isomerase (TIM)